jgi:hypothetical protein
MPEPVESGVSTSGDSDESEVIERKGGGNLLFGIPGCPKTYLWFLLKGTNSIVSCMVSMASRNKSDAHNLIQVLM